MNNLFYLYLVSNKQDVFFIHIVVHQPWYNSAKAPLYYVNWVVCTELCWLSSSSHFPSPTPLLHLVYHTSYYVILFITNKVKCEHWIIISERRYIINHAWNPLRPDAFIKVNNGHSHWRAIFFSIRNLDAAWSVVRTVQCKVVFFLLLKQLPWEDSTM